MAENVGEATQTYTKIGAICSGVCNFADLANFGRSQTISLVSRPKFAKNYKSHTAITSIAIRALHESSKKQIKKSL